MLQTKFLTGFSLTLSLFGGLLFGSPAVQAQASSLIISEINPFGSVNKTNCKTVQAKNRCGFDKWIEIHNPTSKSINLKGWTLRLGDSVHISDNLGTSGDIEFTQDITLGPKDYFLIGYQEKNYQSTLRAAGFSVGGFSYKLKNLSSKTTGSIKVELVNPSKESVAKIILDANSYPSLLESSPKYSLENSGGNWSIATREYYQNNFGTPTNTVVVGLDLDNQRPDRVVAIPTKPDPKIKPTPSTPVEPAPIPEPEKTPEPSPIKNPELAPLPIEAPESVKVPEMDPAPFVKPEPTPVFEPKNLAKPVSGIEASLPRVWVAELIKKQSLIFQSEPVTGPESPLHYSSQSVTMATTQTTSSRHLWEYFFSYQALGLFVILSAIAFAFFERESIRQGLSLNYFEYNRAVQLD